MPARKAAPPGRIPLLLPSHIRRGELPECEVRGIALARNIADAPFRELGFEVEPRKRGPVGSTGAPAQLRAAAPQAGPAKPADQAKPADAVKPADPAKPEQEKKG